MSEIKVEVKRQWRKGLPGNRWDIIVNGKVVEGGYHSKENAEEMADQYRRGKMDKDGNITLIEDDCPF